MAKWVQKNKDLIKTQYKMHLEDPSYAKKWGYENIVRDSKHPDYMDKFCKFLWKTDFDGCQSQFEFEFSTDPNRLEHLLNKFILNIATKLYGKSNEPINDN